MRAADFSLLWRGFSAVVEHGSSDHRHHRTLGVTLSLYPGYGDPNSRSASRGRTARGVEFRPVAPCAAAAFADASTLRQSALRAFARAACLATFCSFAELASSAQ